MFKLCLLADTHRQHRELTIPPCDILIHCGDMCSFQNDDLGTLEDIDAWFAEVPAKRVVCIGGNHDFLLHHREFRFAHADYLCDQSLNIDGITIYGAPWCPDLSGFAFYLSDEDLQRKWEAIPSGIDILVTHTPPQGILDLPFSSLIHVGCPHLRAELPRIGPRLHVFGHIHASHGEFTENVTKFINASVVAGPEFKITHAPVVYQFGKA